MTHRIKLAQVHSALGHPRRLKILEILTSQPNGLTFEDISHRARINPSTLAHHIRCLQNAGFLLKTIKGPYSIFNADLEPMHVIADDALLQST